MQENFMISLEIMAKGMGSIFVVIGLLTLIVMGLAKITGGKKKESSNE
ncbi:MAG: hypothetical protein K0S76_2611 [Herbinix sp.]|jgi:Na+-transporting methylmalonyl-CoA/oxaloacetate decarboxylase gamma subunit|nr:hypothetical protein [Herbinix sp.]